MDKNLQDMQTKNVELNTQEKMQQTLYSYLVHDSYDSNLQNQLKLRGRAFSLKTVCQVCICLLHQLE